MKRLVLIASMLAVSAGLAATGQTTGTPDPGVPVLPVLVTANWLGARLQEPDLVVVQVCATHREYARGHIPGARFLWYPWLAPSTPEASTVMPELETARAVLAGFGVGPGSRIVLSGGPGRETAVARIFATLEYLGLAGRVAVLDGGLTAWSESGGTLTADPPTVVPALPELRLQPGVLVDADELNRLRQQPDVAVLDARSAAAFRGESGGAPRPGHIPGAGSVPSTELVEKSGTFKPRPELEQLFQKAGAAPGETVLAYCNVGMSASLVYLAARHLGYAVRLYDGSFEEWSDRADLPLEVSPAPPPAANK
jgi:thiosulfate/3-mercaptopyruvate sulfurtransferase